MEDHHQTLDHGEMQEDSEVSVHRHQTHHSGDKEEILEEEILEEEILVGHHHHHHHHHCQEEEEEEQVPEDPDHRRSVGFPRLLGHPA